MLGNEVDKDKYNVLNINKKHFLDIYTYKPYYNQDYKQFLTGLEKYTKKSTMIEQELLLWKLFSEEKFKDIIDKYDKNELSILDYSIEEQETFNKLNNYLTCIYSNKLLNTCSMTYSDQENRFIEVVSNVYNRIYIPQEKKYLSKIIL